MIGRHKYNVAPAGERIYRGVRYDSKAEAMRAAELDLLVRAGLISRWERQPKITLGVPENVYRPDFYVELPGGGFRYEDVKGFETPKFRHDKRLWRAYGPGPLWIVSRKGDRCAVVEHIYPKDFSLPAENDA